VTECAFDTLNDREFVLSALPEPALAIVVTSLLGLIVFASKVTLPVALSTLT